MYDMEAIQAWLAMQDGEDSEKASMIINVKPKRCGGCGKFMPKDVPMDMYVIIRDEPYHMTEKCLTNGIKKLRDSLPLWDWPQKEYEI